MPTHQSFWNKAAEKYSKSPIKDMAAYEATLDRARAHLTSEMRVLEIGCGTGTTALKLADTGADITATDISENMIAIAERKRQDAGVANVAFQTATLGDDAFAHESFDAVLAFNLLHLIEGLPAALQEVHRLVKPGGLFISKTICLSEGPFFYRLVIPVMRTLGKAPYVSFFKTAELDNMIEAAGFGIIETGYYPEKSRSRFVVARKRS